MTTLGYVRVVNYRVHLGEFVSAEDILHGRSRRHAHPPEQLLRLHVFIREAVVNRRGVLLMVDERRSFGFHLRFTENQAAVGWLWRRCAVDDVSEEVALKIGSAHGIADIPKGGTIPLTILVCAVIASAMAPRPAANLSALRIVFSIT